MLKKRITCFLVFVFFIWLALATRKYVYWFYPVIVKYGGDIFWATAFLFLLRMFFPSTKLFWLVILNFSLGVLDEVSQLYHGPLAVAVRSTYIGRLMFGVGFLWSDITCYAIGTVIGWVLLILIDRLIGEAKPHLK